MSAMTTDSVRLSRRQTSFKVRPIQVALYPRIRTMSFGASSLRRTNMRGQRYRCSLRLSPQLASTPRRHMEPRGGKAGKHSLLRQTVLRCPQLDLDRLAYPSPRVSAGAVTAPARTLQMPAIKARAMSFFDREWSPGQRLRNEWYAWHVHSVGGAGHSANAGR